MVDINGIIAHIKRKYPQPGVQPEWVRLCVEAIQAEGQVATPQLMLEEYTYSDLAISALPSLPTDIASLHNTYLFPTPTSLQITFLTEIGSSAIHLQNTLESRRDVLSGKTRIRGMDDDPDAAEGEEVDFANGKLPEYPRAMLKVSLSDGRGIAQAMEHKRLNGLKLGETKLGCKVLLHNVKVLRGILLLTPQNTTVIGGEVDHLEVNQPDQFVASLKERIEAAKHPRPKIPIARTKPKPAKRAPKRLKTESKVRQDKTSTSASAALPRQATGRGRGGSVQTSSRAGRQSLPITIDDQTEDEEAMVDKAEKARRARAVAILGLSGQQKRSTTQNSRAQESEEDDYGLDDDPDESFLRHVEMAEVAATQHRQSTKMASTNNRDPANDLSRNGHESKEYNDADEEYEADDIWEDDSFLKHIDDVQLGSTSQAKSSGSAGTDARAVHRTAAIRYIDVDDDQGDYGEFDLDDDVAAGHDDSIVEIPEPKWAGPSNGSRKHGIGRNNHGHASSSGHSRASGNAASGRSVPMEVIEISD